MLTSVRFGPNDHGCVVSDDELQVADFRSGYDNVHRREHDRWNVIELGPDAIYETPWLPGLKLTISPGA